MHIPKKSRISLVVSNAFGNVINKTSNSNRNLRKEEINKEVKSRIEHSIENLNSKMDILAEKIEKIHNEKSESSKDKNVKLEMRKTDIPEGQKSQDIIFVRRSSEYTHYM